MIYIPKFRDMIGIFTDIKYLLIGVVSRYFSEIPSVSHNAVLTRSTAFFLVLTSNRSTTPLLKTVAGTMQTGSHNYPII